VLNPSPDQSTDANGIPDADAQAPQSPTRTHAKTDQCAQPIVPTQQEWFSWRLTQRYFFDPTFGNAVVTGRRNIFDSTLALSGIAFLTEPRNISPLISRMRFRTSGHTDLEWDFDYDTGASRFTSSNIFLDARKGALFGGISYALLQAPGRFATETIDTNNNDQATLTTSPTSNFKQMRVLGGFGDPNRPGLAVAANAGIDINLDQIQYAAIQVNYNWNCCGLSVEYRKYELGAVRNENAYRFNFTLANIGSAGNLRRAERLF
jgi:LPS-assembly protein